MLECSFKSCLESKVCPHVSQEKVAFTFVEFSSEFLPVSTLKLLILLGLSDDELIAFLKIFIFEDATSLKILLKAMALSV
jgi:hypothetical protein